MKSIVINYVCECGNRSPVTGGTSDANRGIAQNIGSSMIVYDHCKTDRVICLMCGKDMKLQVSKEETKTEIEIIQEI